jgi:protein O-mannosyl-transferase
VARPRRNGSKVEASAPAWRRFLWLVPGIVAAIVFAGSLKSGFAVDDEAIIEKNEVAHDASNLGRIFGTDYWVSRGSRGKLYRPLTILTYAWNHAAGGLDPRGYHLANVVLHALVSMLVYAVIRALGAPAATGLVAGVLYAVHPIHVEAVSNVVGRAELLSTAGVLAALWAYVRACGASEPGRRLRLHLAALAAFAAAVFSKENAITFVVIPPLYDALFLRGTGTAWAAARKRLGWHAAYAGVAVLYLVARGAVLGGLTIEDVPYEDNPIAALPPRARILSAIALVGRYAWLMVFPKTLSYIYGPGAVTPVGSVLAPAFLAGLALLAGLIALAVRTRVRNPFVAFWAAFALITFSIVSNVVVPIGTAFAERLLYLPSVGLLALAGAALVRAAAAVSRDARGRRRVLAALVIVLGGACAWRSWLRDQDWRSNRVLFLSQERTPVRSSQSTFNAGLMRFEDKDYRTALGLFDESVAFHPTAKALYFSGRAHGALREDAERARIYGETAERFPGSFHGELAAGWLLTQKDRYAEALPHFQAALKLMPTDGAARFNVGVAMIRTQDFEGAVDVLGQRLDGDEMLAERKNLLANALEGRAVSLQREQKYADAARHYRRLLELAPKHPKRAEIEVTLEALRKQGY